MFLRLHCISFFIFVFLAFIISVKTSLSDETLRPVDRNTYAAREAAAVPVLFVNFCKCINKLPAVQQGAPSRHIYSADYLDHTDNALIMANGSTYGTSKAAHVGNCCLQLHSDKQDPGILRALENLGQGVFPSSYVFSPVVGQTEGGAYVGRYGGGIIDQVG